MTRSVNILLAGMALTLAGVSLVEAQGAACMPRTIYHVRSLADFANEEHVTGFLRADARVRYQCSCDSGCRSTCTPAWQVKRCRDRGIVYQTPYRHNVYKRTKLKAYSRPWAIAVNGGGADCGAGLACFAKKCILGLCGGLSTVTAVVPLSKGFSVTFTANAAVVHDLGLDLPFQCDRCVTSAELSRDYPQITQVIQPPSVNMQGWLEICTFHCGGTSCSGNVCWETCTESCNLY